MIETRLNDDEMYRALRSRDAEYDGLFWFGVKTTGIFCRPTCSAKKPLRKNVRFFPDVQSALSSGFRPCKRCRPQEAVGHMPPWLERIVRIAEQDAQKRWTDADLRAHRVDPTRVRRWFQRSYGITFHSFLRARRLSQALARLSAGQDSTKVAFETGYESLSGFREAFGKWCGSTPGQVKSGHRHVLINRIASPLGPLLVAADDRALLLLEFADRKQLPSQFESLSRQVGGVFVPGTNPLLQQTEQQLDEYFEGTRQQFDLPLEIVGTQFQRAVWGQLQQISYGQTRSYQQIARSVGNDRAVRAVGRANGENRLAILVPCHRVIRSDGSLSGYGGGVRRKEWLLAHEQSVLERITR